MSSRLAFAALAVALALPADAAPNPEPTPAPWPDPKVLENLEWRNIGPANMMGRVADIEGVPGDPDVVYVGSASGGVWKSVDAGISWKPIFDKEPVASIGDIALEPGNPDVVYVGTGESNVRNSVSFGNGVYKSTDGGLAWKHLGLAESGHISRVLVDPRDPHRVLVGALGHAFGSNPERGVFLSVNGGESWEKTLYLDERHGVSDMDLDPRNPNVVYAALWRFERKPWTHTSGSDQGGVWRSVDGGRSWKKLEKGLPKTMGRISVKVAPSDPRVVYVLAESNEGTLFRSDDRGETFSEVSRDAEIVNRGFYYTDLRVDPRDENRVYAVASRLQQSIDGGKTWKRLARSIHIDFHALWIDPLNPARMWNGQDGGIAVSNDRGGSWEYANHFPLAQFYQLYADDRQPFYHLGGGLQDNGTWSGPSRTREPAGILNDDWRMVSFGDGFHIVSHPERPELFLSESQAGAIVRTDMTTRDQKDVSPQPRRNDGGPVAELEYRFNWNAPIVASPHDGRVVYFGANVVFRSRDFGTTWEAISPDLTTNDPEKQKTAGGPVWFENTTAEYHCTLISLAESAAQAGVLWAGSDDGNLQLTQDGGGTWANLTKNVPGLPAHSPVSHVEPSRRAAGTAWAAFDRHMFDDFRPYVFKTTDFGRSWVQLTDGLPDTGYVHVLREDPKNPNLLYAGTELGLYASWDGGKRWHRLHLKNLPTVAVHDILIHPRENDLILGTHGRAIWILDDATPIQQLSPQVTETALHVFPARAGLRFAQRFTRYGIGDKVFKGPNPPYGAVITYSLKQKPDEKAKMKLEVLDAAGAVVREIKDKKPLPRGAGLNRAVWDLNYETPRQRKDPEADDAAGDFGGGPRGPRALPGSYRVRLTVGKESAETRVDVALDPAVKAGADELTRQFELAATLRDALSSVNDTLRRLDSLKQQAEERKRLGESQIKPLPEELGKAVDAAVEAVKKLVDPLARPEGKPTWSERPRLVERLGDLFGDIDGPYPSPNAAQIAYHGELVQESKQAVADAERGFADVEKTLNEALARHGLPLVAARVGPATAAAHRDAGQALKE
jgi:photosystem II stability/assembly factor-like uncharacterized protein